MFTSDNFLKKTLRNEKGIALLLVMGVIAILTFLLAEFTFETKLNKIKIYNQEDKIQARLNAEAGLNFALAKLRLYQEGRNKIEKDDNLKAAFPSSDLEAIIIQPFIYPPPISAKANLIQKSAVDEFMKKTVFNGEVSITFTKISGFLNPNGLRLKPNNNASAEDNKQNENNNGNDNDNQQVKTDAGTNKTNTPAEPASVVIEKKLVETLSRLLKDKNLTDEDFHRKYANTEANYLIQELKYYVSDKGTYQGNQRPEIEAKFSQKSITPKFAPMSSIDELYLLPSWDDAIVDLIKDRLSVHDVSVIAVNELTIEDLKILFPSINNIQIEEFFKYRDGDIDKKIKGKKFKDAEDFKRVITTELSIVTDAEYNERMNTLKSAGLVIDTSGKIYRISSRGTMNSAVYNITAIVDLPIKPEPKKPPPPNAQINQQTNNNQNADDDPAGVNQAQDAPADQNKKPTPTELLKPRIVEIRVE